MQQQKISIYDFQFENTGYGNYKVTYRSPLSLRMWVNVTNDMTLIDATKNADEPKAKDLKKLKRLCKARNSI